MIEYSSIQESLLLVGFHHVADSTGTFSSGGKTHQSNVPALSRTKSIAYAYFTYRPVGLKEAALDSPTFRATAVHFSEQVDLIERWADDYLKSTSRLLAETATLENVIGSFISHALLPSSITEAALDHDYSVLAMRKYGEGAKDFWMSTLGVIKRLTAVVAEPIRSFLQNDLRAFKVGYS